MKNILYILGILAVFSFTSCEQEELVAGEVDTNTLSGEWFVNYDHTIYGLDPFQAGYTKIITANSSADNGTNMIITDEGNFWDYRVKVPINEATLSFGGNDTLISYVTDYDIKVLIRNGQIIKDAVSTSSGIVADSIYFEIWFEDLEGATAIASDTLFVSGYRRTGFNEDEH